MRKTKKLVDLHKNNMKIFENRPGHSNLEFLTVLFINSIINLNFR